MTSNMYYYLFACVWKTSCLSFSAHCIFNCQLLLNWIIRSHENELVCHTKAEKAKNSENLEIELIVCRLTRSPFYVIRAQLRLYVWSSLMFWTDVYPYKCLFGHIFQRLIYFRNKSTTCQFEFFISQIKIKSIIQVFNGFTVEFPIHNWIKFRRRKKTNRMKQKIDFIK